MIKILFLSNLFSRDIFYKSVIIIYMTTIQTMIQTLWNAIVSLGFIKVLGAVIIIAILSRLNKVLGIVAAILFVAHLLGWI